MKNIAVLIVEDDELTQQTLAQQLKGHALQITDSLKAALAKLKSRKYDLAFVDLRLGENDDYSGLTLIPQLKSRGVYTVVMSGHDDDEMIEQAYEAGCDDFFAKGNEPASIAKVLDKFRAADLDTDAAEIFADQYVTQDKETRKEILRTLKYAPGELPILILGPSGTGKTSLARLIHERSGRKGRFVDMNCAAFSPDLLEAELFGHKKGAFTGAVENRKGKLAEADGGTLFLDEIGSMPRDMQTKLLKAIEERRFYPVGSNEPVRSEFRIISATLEDIQDLTRTKKLRLDFYSRISGVEVALKPLARRKTDIFPLIEYFTRNNKRLSFTKDGREYLRSYAWPMNIRELEKTVELLASGTTGRIARKDIVEVQSKLAVGSHEGELLTDAIYQHALKTGLHGTLAAIRRAIIRRQLDDNSGNKTRTMKNLKIVSNTLYAALKDDQANEN